MAITVSDLLIRVRAETGEAMASLGVLNKGLLGIGALAVGVAAVGLVKMGMEAQTQLSIVAGLTGATAKQMDYYTTSLENMGERLGFTLDQSAKGLYYVVSAGFKGADAINVLNEAMLHAAAAGAPLQDVANGLTSAMNAYGASAKDATYYSDILTTAVTYGKQTTADFANNVSKAALMASAAHVPFIQLAAAEASLTEKGEPANRAFMELSFMMSKISINADAVGKSVRAMGGNFDVTKYSSLDLMGKLEYLRNETGLTTDQFLKVVGGTRSARAALGLLTDGGKAYDDIINKMRNDTGVTAAAFDVHTKTMAYGFDTVKAAVSNAGYELVKMISPAVVPFLLSLASAVQGVPALFHTLGDGAKWASDHMDIMKPVIAGVATVLAVMLVPTLWAAAAAVTAIDWPLLLIAAGLGILVGALVTAYNNVKSFRDMVQTLAQPLQAIGDLFQPMASKARIHSAEMQVAVVDHMQKMAQDSVAALDKQRRGILDQLKRTHDEGTKIALAFKAHVVTQHEDMAKQSAQNAKHLHEHVVYELEQTKKTGIQHIAEMAGGIIKHIAGMAKEFIGHIGDIMGHIGDLIGKLWELRNNLLQRLQPAIHNVSEKIAELRDWIHTQLMPVLHRLWSFFQANILPVLQQVGGFIKQYAIDRLRDLWVGIQTILLPILGTLAGFLVKGVGNGFQTLGWLIDGVSKSLGTLIGWIGAALGWLGNLRDALSKIHPPNLGDFHIPGFAAGGLMPGGAALVGEKGPELALFPAGTRIIPNSQTQALMQGSGSLGGSGSGGGGGNVPNVPININIAGRTVAQVLLPDLVAEIRRSTGVRI